MSVVTAATILVPLAMSVAGKCFMWGSRIRDVHQIKKVCIICPRKCGKSWLASHLSGNERVILVDTDEFAKAFMDEGRRSILASVSADPTLHQALSHAEYDRCLEHVKELLKASKDKRAVFLTSDPQWALKTFKKDAIFSVVPSSDFMKEMPIEGEDKELLERSRALILHKLPAEVVKVYGSYEELEAILRLKFDFSTAL